MIPLHETSIGHFGRNFHPLGKKPLGVLGLISAVWFGLVFSFPDVRGVLGFILALVAYTLILIWIGILYHLIEKDVERREKLERLARYLQHKEVRILLDEFEALSELLDDHDFRTFRQTSPNLTLALFLALAGAVILYVVS